MSTDNKKKKRYFRYPRKKVCQFCANKVEEIDYKDVDTLMKYVTERYKIIGRKTTSTCAKHQRMLTRAIKRARVMALMPFTISRKLKG
ncbi:30S ribosomal protein S18 [Hippea alviniae]|uniref:30S ribosomal protein S18 n=1 Tax=Hippea alviniae TaxID=1279027 RepID=UPI0003B4E539|nr:30S ribosomal protein S18 [Hippea alviniae]